MFRTLLAALSLALTPIATSAQAQIPIPATESEQQAAPPRLRQRDVSETTLVSRDGLEYRILASVPSGPAPEGGFPVFTSWTATPSSTPPSRSRARANGAADAVDRRRRRLSQPRLLRRPRTHDFTPPGSADPDWDPGELGGADKFLAFLTDELQPWVRERYAVNPERQILFGHSLGGLFVLHAMFTAPRSFGLYLAASPTLRFSDSLIIREARAFEHHPMRSEVRALITVGGLESQPPPEQVDDYRRYFSAHPEATGGVDVEEALRQMFPVERSFNKARETRRLAQRLQHSGADVTFAEFEGDEHLPAGVTALLRGIPFALRPER